MVFAAVPRHRLRRRSGAMRQGPRRPQHRRRRMGPQRPAACAPVPSWKRRPVFCGRSGCIETFLAGPAFEADYRARTGHLLPAAAIAELAARGDPAAAEALHTYEDRLARALGLVINLIDPDVIVLGGGISNIRHLYEAVPSPARPLHVRRRMPHPHPPRRPR